MNATVGTHKGIVTFIIKILSIHLLLYAGFGSFLMIRLRYKELQHSRLVSDYLQFLLHLRYENPNGVCEFNPAAVHRHYTIGHWFSVLLSALTALLLASSPYRDKSKRARLNNYILFI